MAVLITSPMVLSLLVQATFAAIFAVGVGFLIRQNGMVSFGHAAFYGLPGYLIGMLLPGGMLPAELLIIGAVLLTGILGFAIGLVIVRVHGIAFGMLTLAIGQGLYVAFTRMRGITGGHDGMNLRLPRELFGLPLKLLQQPTGMLIVSWLFLIAILFSIWLFSRSHWGRLTEGIRDNEERIRFLGYPTLLPRALVFAASTVIAAIGGVLFVVYNTFISPDAVHWTASGSALIMAILGGAGSTWGPALGAFVYFFLKEVAGTYTTHWLSIIGVALILVSVAFPTGLAGLVTRWFKPVRAKVAP
jgi:branched-chain amino acid transport system permease protein